MELLEIIRPINDESKRLCFDFITKGLTGQAVNCAWANFTLTHQEATYEVDLVVLTEQGFWLVEERAWSGRISGFNDTWTLTHNDNVRTIDNPLLLADRKARALASLVKAQPATTNVQIPSLEAIVVLSADDVQVDLTGPARNRVLLKNRADHDILAVLTSRIGPGIDPAPSAIIDNKVVEALSYAMEEITIKESVNSLMQEAEDWVQLKRSEGWTKEDFLQRLSEILGTEEEQNDGSRQ